MNPALSQERIEGLLLGTAVADAIGLPTEGMTPAKIKKLGWADSLKHRFFFGRGMWSDDTEQTIMLAQALLKSEGDCQKFTRAFSWELRWWILGMPAATGLATARAIIKLWLGFPPKCSGVFSAGNGTAMRTSPIAAYFPSDATSRREFCKAQSQITHSDPKAFFGALAVTELTALFLNSDTTPSPEEVLQTIKAITDDPDWLELVKAIQESSEAEEEIADLLPRIGGNPKKGVSGYIYQTFPAVILAGIRSQWDFQKTISRLLAAGGDTDTTAAIAGSLCGALHGTSEIPSEWINGIKEWPTSITKLSTLAKAIKNQTPLRIRSRWSPLLILRNLFFLLVVLFHGFARLIPR